VEIFARVSGARLLSWFSLGLLAGAGAAPALPAVGMALAFLIVMFGVLGALLTHALAEQEHDRGAVVRAAAAYLVGAVAAAIGGLWWMSILLAAGGIATAFQAQRWGRTHRPALPATA
jgi:hypothetical protein